MRARIVGGMALRAIGLSLCILVGLGCQDSQEPHTLLKGSLVDESGRAVAGATVTLLDLPYRVGWKFNVIETVRSDKEGRFAFGLDEETFKKWLWVTAADEHHGLAFCVPNRTDLRLGEALDLELTLPERASVSGRVANEAGYPIEGARITALITLPSVTYKTGTPYMPTCAHVLQTETEVSGTFVLDGLPDGAQVCVVAKHPRFAPAVEGAPEDLGDTYRAGIDVGDTNVSLTMQAPSTVSGTVTAKGTGLPVAGAKAMAVPLFGGLLGLLHGFPEAETDANGRYLVAGLPPVDHRIYVKHPDFLETFQRVALVEPAILEEQDIIVDPGVLLSGAFVDWEGNAPEGIGISLEDRAKEGPERYLRVTYGKDGTFHTRLLPGEYALRAFCRSGRIPKQQRHQEITLEAGKDVTDLIIEVQAPAVFRGKVVDGEGNPVAGARVTYRRHYPTAETLEDGSFELPLPDKHPRAAGRVTLRAELQDNPGLRGIFHGEVEKEGRDQGTIVMKPVATVTGRVVDEDGEPIHSARVSVATHFDGSTSFDRPEETGEDGHYALSGVITGEDHSLRVMAEGYIVVDSERFTLAPGENKEFEAITLRRAD